MVWRQKPRKLFLEKLFSTYQPRKLYCGLRVEFNQGGRKLTPAKYEYTFNEFRSNNSMLELIQLQLGSIWLNQLLALITGGGTSLVEMPEFFLKEISQYLSMNDLLRLSSTCRYLNKFYSSDEIWKPIFEKFLRSICTYSDYTQVQNHGGYKQICHKICMENKEKDHTKNLLTSDHIVMGSSQAKMFLSLSTSRFEQCTNDSPKHSQSTPLFESEESYELLPRANKSESRIHFDSESILKSQTYQTTVSTSTSSLVHCSDKDEYQDRSDEARGSDLKKCSEDSSSQMKDDFYFTKSDLMRRLNYLTMKTKKYECEDNVLPGDQTKNYALKYRD
ncbi:uncharacterized protein LOC119649139 isoform X2 [Hermetia illucens]|uniref:uncharacterized protein LOC119649139 isoform X2 n=1 Tax=Hermetia illucens TaxID=343691 RepID=UPI0018CBF765|nr:uncharacterized protein LOC119649139 isoform X2 [Hermetia illucens]